MASPLVCRTYEEVQVKKRQVAGGLAMGSFLPAP